MIPIDTLTTYIMAGLLYLVLPLITWFALARQRTQAVDLWCLGGMFGGIGLLLVGLRGNLPELLTYPVANSAIVLSFLLRVKSLHLDLGVHGSTRRIAALYLAYIGLYLPLFLANMETLLGIWARLGMVLAGAWLVGGLVKVARQEQSRNAAAIAVVYGLLLFAISALLLMTVFGTSTLSQPLTGMDIQMVIFSASIASIVGHFSYMGLVLERSGRTRAAVAIDNARIEAVRLKHRELAALDRRRSLGMITSSLSHELSQPLTAISITTQIAQRTLRHGEIDPPVVNDLLTRIVFNIKRASQVIEQIRGFVRPAESKPQTFDVRQTVKQVLQLFWQDLLKERVEIVLDLPDEPAIFDGDPMQVAQVVMHAVRNAVEATHAMPVRKVGIRLIHTDTLLVIEIEDNGPGLSEEAVSKVGTAFFTTKPGNLGLGLAISHQILSLCQGKLHVANRAGGGACTRIHLPSGT